MEKDYAFLCNADPKPAAERRVQMEVLEVQVMRMRQGGADSD